jgi:protein arginine N-methyltransferase 1
MTYNIVSYNRMIADRVRIEAYNRAARGTIKQGSVIAELGAGSGYFAVLACKLGAKKVYAIEPDGVIELARAVAEANGCAERIEFIQNLSTKITLPEKVDVIFSDLRGALPLFYSHIPSIIDARTRFLKPGGVLVPKQDDIFGAFVSSPAIYSRYCEVAPRSLGEPDLSATRSALRNSAMHTDVKPSDCVSSPLHLGTLNYATIESSTFQSTVSWAPAQPVVIHGMCLWFEATLTDDARFSTGPFGVDMVYGRMFFPFSEPIALEPGESVSFAFQGILIGSDYVWRWDTTVTSADGSIKTEFRQSTFEASSTEAHRALRRSGDYVPRSTEKQALSKFVLERVDGVKSLDVIGGELVEKFPELFPELQIAVKFAGEVVETTS